MAVFLKLLLLMLLSFSTFAQESVRREDQFKAAYLLNFVSLVEWPAATSADKLTICFFGGQGVLASLSVGIDKKLVGNRHLDVKQLAKSQSLTGCNAIYIDAASNQSPSYNALSGQPILTVSDARDFTKSGGMIGLFTSDNRLRFNINIGAANKSGLRISSKLLQLAASVDKGEQP